MIKHIEKETKWPLFSRHFQMDFFNENVWITTKLSLKFVPIDPINNITSRQAIIRTYDGRVYWRIYASLGLHDLEHLIQNSVANTPRTFSSDWKIKHIDLVSLRIWEILR